MRKPTNSRIRKIKKIWFMARELGLIHKCKVNVIPYVMTWDRLLQNTTAIQGNKKTLESISLEYRQGLREGGSAIEDVTSILKRISSHNAEKYNCNIF
ncbi:hypothetical protein NAPIS_ORF00712 [Vairimorpha apis BRL 01]|uniref:Uncharacterized protein n=1 Tax=Vairimorpha apis BRL 01 TaxID=1037528 RepID=T0ML21_9MICR|nr:hypothetical protein NAPIS_ORF00712 [Vairimorpha apis BRL 01]